MGKKKYKKKVSSFVWLKEAADEIGYGSAYVITKLIKTGILKARQLGGFHCKWQVLRASLDEYLEKNTVKQEEGGK